MYLEICGRKPKLCMKRIILITVAALQLRVLLSEVFRLRRGESLAKFLIDETLEYIGLYRCIECERLSRDDELWCARCDERLTRWIDEYIEGEED